MKNPKYRITYFYNGYCDSRESKIQKLVGYSDGSGFDFETSSREHAWYRSTLPGMRTIVKRLRKLHFGRIIVRVYDPKTDEYDLLERV